jgi:hypothetical protein
MKNMKLFAILLLGCSFVGFSCRAYEFSLRNYTPALPMWVGVNADGNREKWVKLDRKNPAIHQEFNEFLEVTVTSVEQDVKKETVKGDVKPSNFKTYIFENTDEFKLNGKTFHLGAKVKTVKKEKQIKVFPAVKTPAFKHIPANNIKMVDLKSNKLTEEDEDGAASEKGEEEETGEEAE